MYGAEQWWVCPMLLIPSGFIWVCFDTLIEDFCIDKKIAEKYGWQLRTVKRWTHKINAVLSVVIVFLIFALIYKFTGFNVINWAKKFHLWRK